MLTAPEGRDMADIFEEWRRLSGKFAETNGTACVAAEEAKAAMREDAKGGIPYSPLTVAKFERAVSLLAEARRLMAQLIEVHTRLFPDDRKIFAVKAMVETNVQKLEGHRDRLHLN